MFQPSRSVKTVKIIAIVGAVALMLIPTGILIKTQLADLKYQHQVVAAVYVDICGQSVIFAVTGSGVIDPIDQPPEIEVQAIGKAMGKLGDNHAVAVQACPEGAPQQQTYLHP